MMFCAHVIPAFLLLSTVIQAETTSAPDPESSLAITTHTGKVRGKLIEVTPTLTCQAFLGLPFASPPLGDLRFRKPADPVAWDGVRSAETLPPICISVASGVEVPNEDENCLYLHIVLKNRKPKQNDEKLKPLPVMFWLYGGGFVGARSQFTPENACANLASQNVLIVAVQYRVGYLGFLATGDAAARGNFGLWDQVAALRWVQRNIANFGGDPMRVTVFGSSAGGASGSLLSYSPTAQPLFRRVISQSGSAFAYWAFNRRSVHSFPRLANAAGCGDHSVDSNSRLDCLRQKSIDQLQESHVREFGLESYAKRRRENEQYNGGGHNLIEVASFDWSPRVDGDLIPYGREDLGKMVKIKPTMIGTTNDECLLFTKAEQHWPWLWSIVERHRESIIPFFVENDEDFEPETFDTNLDAAIEVFQSPEDYSPKPVKYFDRHDVLHQYAKAIYLRDISKTRKSDWVKQLTQLASDFWMHLPIIQDADNKKKLGGNVWLYNLDYTPNNYPKEYPDFWKGAQHEIAAHYLFLDEKYPNVTAEMFEFSKLVCKLWTNFAKYGNPTPPKHKATLGFDWPKYESINRPLNLMLNLKPTVAEEFHHETIPFWIGVAPRVLKHADGVLKDEL